jgi:hypothetical protein
MAEIYTKAQRVLIWLGPSFENSDNLMDFISHCAESETDHLNETMPRTVDAWIQGRAALRMESEHMDTVHQIQETGAQEEQTEVTSGQDGRGMRLQIQRHDRSGIRLWLDRLSRRAARKDFYKLYCRTCRHLVGLGYFKRAWIIQEVMLASESIVRLGSRTILWKDMANVLHYMQNPVEQRRTFSSFNGTDLVRIAALSQNSIESDGMTPTRSGSHPNPREHNWASAWQFITGSECTDMRDKAFAILGLLPERLRIYPDYSLEGHEVVFELTRVQIADRLSLLDRQCAAGVYLQSKRAKSRHISKVFEKSLSARNILEAYMAAAYACFWYYEMYRGRQLGYDTTRLRSFIYNEILAAYRAQRLAQGSGLGHVPCVEKLLIRLLAPREDGLYFWLGRRAIHWGMKTRMATSTHPGAAMPSPQRVLCLWCLNACVEVRRLLIAVTCAS